MAVSEVCYLCLNSQWYSEEEYEKIKGTSTNYTPVLKVDHCLYNKITWFTYLYNNAGTFPLWVPSLDIAKESAEFQLNKDIKDDMKNDESKSKKI